MNKKIIWIILVVVICVAAFAGIAALYDKLSSEYVADQFADPAPAPAEPAPEATTPPEEAPAEEVSYAAPDFAAIDGAGNSVRLSDYFGKPTIMTFWASWCYYCKEELMELEALSQDYPEVQILAVNVLDGSEEALAAEKQYFEECGYAFPVLYDVTQEAAYTYGASSLPMIIFIDENGDLFTYGRGLVTGDQIRQVLALMGVEPVESVENSPAEE